MAAKKRTKTTETDNRSEADKREEARKQFVAQKKAQGVSAKEANTQFYVQTRAKELAAKGVTVDAAKRKQLRQNYESGNVKRAGFGVTPVSGKPASKPASKPATKPEPKKNTNSTTSTRVQASPDRMAGPRRNQTMVDRMPSPGRTTSGVSADRFPSPPRSQGGTFRLGLPVLGKTAAGKKFEQDRAAYEKQMAAMKRMRGKK